METSWQLQVEEGKGDVHGRERRQTSEEQSHIALDALLPHSGAHPCAQESSGFL